MSPESLKAVSIQPRKRKASGGEISSEPTGRGRQGSRGVVERRATVRVSCSSVVPSRRPSTMPKVRRAWPRRTPPAQARHGEDPGSSAPLAAEPQRKPFLEQFYDLAWRQAWMSAVPPWLIFSPRDSASPVLPPVRPNTVGGEENTTAIWLQP